MTGARAVARAGMALRTTARGQRLRTNPSSSPPAACSPSET